MTYGTSTGVDRSTRTRPTATAWQRERMAGPLLPMRDDRSLFARFAAVVKSLA